MVHCPSPEPSRLRGVTFLILLLMISGGVIGCGKSGSSGSEAAAVPSSSGQVWEIDRAADRSTMPAAVLAYVHGLHTIVLDGNDAYGGMTTFTTESRPDGSRAIKLAGGLEALLVAAGDGKMELRFSSGESIALRKKEVHQDVTATQKRR